jgi:AraC-like DNA-binding protein
VHGARLRPPDGAGRARSEVALGPHAALSSSATAGVRLFARRPPAHSVLLGRARVEFGGSVHATEAVALPVNTPHRVLALAGPHAAVAYLDARRYRFEDARRLAHAWRGFVPGRDDLREALGDALRLPPRRLDVRVLGALEALDAGRASVREAALGVGLSESRLAHLVSEVLGAPPRAFVAWFKLRRALGEAMLGAATLTQAAHRAGFADPAHLTRTCKRLTGVLPSEMLPHVVHVADDDRGAFG